MASLRARSRVPGLIVIAALLAACNQGGLPASPIGPAPQVLGARARTAADTNGQKLVYVSDIPTSSVYVYTWPGELVKTLTGFEQPYGLCSDTWGNVYVTDLYAARVYEYSHDGDKMATLKDPGELPSSCAVDPQTGNLAVANTAGDHGVGGVSIYAHAKGEPTIYVFPESYYGYFCGYDDRGNLFVDAKNASDGVGLFELPAHGHSLQSISLNRTLKSPGGIQWDGAHLAVGDSYANVIYQVDVTGSAGSVVGTTSLSGASTVWEFWIDNGRVAGANEITSAGDVLVWKYPGGGYAVNEFGNNLAAPFGLTVSLPGR